MSGEQERVLFRGLQGAVRAGKNLPAPRSLLSAYNMNNVVKKIFELSYTHVFNIQQNTYLVPGGKSESSLQSCDLYWHYFGIGVPKKFLQRLAPKALYRSSRV